MNACVRACVLVWCLWTNILAVGAAWGVALDEAPHFEPPSAEQQNKVGGCSGNGNKVLVSFCLWHCAFAVKYEATTLTTTALSCLTQQLVMDALAESENA